MAGGPVVLSVTQSADFGNDPEKRRLRLKARLGELPVLPLLIPERGVTQCPRRGTGALWGLHRRSHTRRGCGWPPGHPTAHRK